MELNFEQIQNKMNTLKSKLETLEKKITTVQTQKQVYIDDLKKNFNISEEEIDSTLAKMEKENQENLELLNKTVKQIEEYVGKLELALNV